MSVYSISTECWLCYDSTQQYSFAYSSHSLRFGDISGRIVELLQRSKYLEQQQVSDMIILPARETRERLYKLYL